ncbi:MAG: ABC transporter permease, partial [Mobilicoccus sp.]|nr:ABC transporter permease [Mobilicoccus sp.]
MTAGLATRGRRLIAAAIAIIIGTAFLTTSLVVLATSQAGIEDAVAGGVRDADLVVSRDNDWLTIEERDAVEAVDGVSVTTGTSMAFLESEGSTLIGVNVPTGGIRLVDGALPVAEGEAAVTSDFGRSIGDTLSIPPLPGPDGEVGDPVQLTVVGVVDPGGMSQLTFSDGFMASDATLRVLDPSLAYRDLQLQVDRGSDAVAAREAITEAVPGATILTGPEAAEAAVNEMTGQTAVMAGILVGFGAVALITAAIVIANAFTITLAQRAGELALLRCVGGSTRQVRRLVLLEAVVLGVMASVVGVLVGIALSAGLLTLARALDVGMPLGTGLAITPISVLAPLAAGVVVTLLAALQPAARATRVSPLEALRPAGEAADRPRVAWWRLGLGLLLFTLGCALMVL